MSDFLFTTRLKQKNKIEKLIKNISNEYRPNLNFYKGDWGMLCVANNNYHGYSEIESDRYICFVIGSPVLESLQKHYIKSNKSNWITNQILNLILEKKTKKIHNQFSGPFVIGVIDKCESDIEIITDIMSFIPVYEGFSSNNITIGTNVDIVAHINGELKPNDKISIADFILNGYITYPYTFYLSTKQLPPASIIKWKKRNGWKADIDNYWFPYKSGKYKNISYAANAVKNALVKYIRKTSNDMSKIATFISGGEDSRLILALLSNFYKKESFIVLDEFNREGKIAKKVAQHFRSKFTYIQRNKNYYLNILIECNKLVGSGAQSTHVHAYKFNKKHNLDQYSAVFGGFYSDALLKGSRIKKIKGYSRVPFIPEIIGKKGYALNKSCSLIIDGNVLDLIDLRHKEHYNRVKKIRPSSVDEWFELWPASMNYNIPNIHGNRRLFNMYEPFLSNDVVKIAANIEQKWKLNRRLFRLVSNQYFKEIKTIPHSDGWFPYFPWYVNSIVHGITYTVRKLISRITKDKKYQGPWSDFNSLMSSRKWSSLISESEEILAKNEVINQIFINTDEIFGSKKLTDTQKRNLVQVLEWLR